MSPQKNYCWIWIAVDRHEKRFVDCVLDDRSTTTGKQLLGSRSLALIVQWTNQLIIDHKLQTKKGFSRQLSGEPFLFDQLFSNVTRGSCPVPSDIAPAYIKRATGPNDDAAAVVAV